MRTKKWAVLLTEEERQKLNEMLHQGTPSSRALNRACLLLLAHENRYDHKVAHIVGVTPTTVANVRRRYVQEGLDAALYDRPHPGRLPRLDGHQEAYLIARAQSPPPEGGQRWTWRLLADRRVALGVVEGIHRRGIGRPEGGHPGPL